AGLFDLVPVADNLPGRTNAKLELFLLERFEEPHLPIPDVQLRRRQPVGFAQADLALQVHLGVVVHIKNDRRFVTAQVLAEAGNELPRPRERFFPRDLKIDGSFRKRLRSEEHTSELQSRFDLVCRLLLEKKKKK